MKGLLSVNTCILCEPIVINFKFGMANHKGTIRANCYTNIVNIGFVNGEVEGSDGIYNCVTCGVGVVVIRFRPFPRRNVGMTG